MEKNVGTGDRVVRIVIGLALALLIYLGQLHGLAALIAGVVAAYLVITAILARCIFYKIGGFDTCVAESSYSTTDDRAGF